MQNIENELKDLLHAKTDQLRKKLINKMVEINKVGLIMKKHELSLQNKAKILNEEREQFIQDCERIQKNNYVGSDLLNLNISGTKKILTTRQLLTCVEGSDMQKAFSGQCKLKEVIPLKNQSLNIMADDITIDRIREDKIIEVFVDRDP